MIKSKFTELELNLIHGIRVELGDIRTSIAKIINDPRRELEILYIDQQVTMFYTGGKIADLQEQLSLKMVSYKVPSRYIEMETLPLTSNGKVNRKALIERTKESNSSLGRGGVLRGNRVKELVSQILKRSVAAEEDLLMIGIDSLNSIELSLVLEDEFGVAFDQNLIYSLRTVNNIEKKIEELLGKTSIKLEKGNTIRLYNNKCEGNVVKKYPLYFYARIYQTLHFDSKLTGQIYLGDSKENYEEFYHRLSKVEILKTIIDHDFEHFAVLDCPLNISAIWSENVHVDLTAELERVVQENRLNNRLLYKLVLLYNENECCLHYSFDHTICDASSIEVFKRFVLGIEKEIKSYEEYIEDVLQNNTEEKSIQVIKQAQIQETEQIKMRLSALSNSPSVSRETYLSHDTFSVYVDILLFLRNKILEELNINGLKVNVLYNLRQYTEKDYSNVFGDIHLGITYFLDRKSDVVATLSSTIEEYQEKMFNPKAVGYRDYPKVSPQQKKIIEYFDETVFVSINYLGVISKQELQVVLDSLESRQEEISKINEEKVNITAYIVDKDLVIISSKSLVGGSLQCTKMK